MILNLHIGYAKTATTYLQEHVFPNLLGINYSGRYIAEYGDDRDHLDWVYKFAKTANLDVNALFSAIPKSKYDNCLFSHEVIMRPYLTDKALTDLKKLQIHSDELRIIVSMRNPIDLIFSRYVHDISTGIFNFYSLEKALDYKGTSQCMWPMCGNNVINKLWRKSPFTGGSCLCNSEKVKSINVPYYDLNVLHQKLTSIFGLGQIHYIISEQLKEKPQEEIQRLCHFLSTEKTAIKFDVSKLDSNTHSNKRSDQKLYQKLKAENSANGVLERLSNHFAKSNKLFDEQSNLNILREIGYY